MAKKKKSKSRPTPKQLSQWKVVRYIGNEWMVVHDHQGYERKISTLAFECLRNEFEREAKKRIRKQKDMRRAS